MLGMITYHTYSKSAAAMSIAALSVWRENILSAPGLSSPSPAAPTCSSRPESHGPPQPAEDTEREQQSAFHCGWISDWQQRGSPYLDQRLHLVQQDGLVAEFHQRLGDAQGERPQSGPVPAHQDQRLHASAVSDRQQGDNSSSTLRRPARGRGGTVAVTGVDNGGLPRFLFNMCN